MVLKHLKSGPCQRVLASLLLLLGALHAQALGQEAPRAPPDKILVNGEVLTMDRGSTVATAIAVTGGTISAVGDTASIRALAGPRTQVFDLQGRTVVPGLIDTHIHAIRGGQSYTFETSWATHARLQDGIDAMKADARRRGAGQWVAVAGGWHPAQFDEKRGPTTVELSEAMPDNPVYVQLLYDHAILNRKAIEVLQLDGGAPPPLGVVIERDAQGRATGRVAGGLGPLSALFNRISGRSPAERRTSLKLFLQELSRHGVTGLVDPAAGDFDVFTPVFSLWRDRELAVRVHYRVSALARENEQQWFRSALAYLPPLFGDDMLRFIGLGEILVGGMNDSIRQSPGFSAPAQARQELLQVASLAAARGYGVEIHAYTDDAASQILDVFEEVDRRYPLKDLRWSLAHLNSGSEKTLERMRRMGMAYSVQMGPYFEADAIRQAAGTQVMEISPPVRLALDKGIVVAGGTDSTRIGVANIWRAIQFHVTGRAVGGLAMRPPSQLLSRQEALRMYTAAAAWISRDESRRGSIETGKLADLAVLSAPFLRIDEAQIHTIRSVMTMLNGEVVHSTPSQ